MRYQARDGACGAASVVNALRALGWKVSEGRVRKIAGTTPQAGTDEHGIYEAVRQLGYSAVPFTTEDRKAAAAVVHSNVLAGRPCILCVDNYGHWVAIVGVVGDRFLLVDPTNTQRNSQENGCHSVSKAELLKRWRNREDGIYFSIVVGKK